MAKRKESQSDETSGAPEWMLTYSDCMTLLLTFFVMLITYSSFDDKIYRRLESAFAGGLSSLSLHETKDNRAFESVPLIAYDRELEAGSERPTVEGKHESNPSQSLDFLDFQSQKVFLLPSDKVFWGRGTRTSPAGRQLLTDIAALLAATSDRIIVSEHTLESDEDAPDLGLRRAWHIIQFLTEQRGLDSARFSMTSAGTVAREVIARSAPFAGRSPAARVLEIVILERSIYQ